MLSRKIEEIALSGTMEMIELKSKGATVFDMCVGEPDLPTPEHIKEAAKKAIDKNKTKYTINSGIQELRQAVCDKFEHEYNAKYSLNEVIICNGAKQAVYNSLQAVLNVNDEVLLPLPYYVSYAAMIHLAGGKIKLIPTKIENSFKVTVEEIKNNLTVNTKAIILCNPNNPTGAVFNRDEINDILDCALENNLLVISDEIYEKLIYDSIKFVSTAELGEKYKYNLIIINGVSKAYDMTGWRIGYAVANNEYISGMNKLQSHSTSNACSVSQYAALAALTGPQEIVEKQRLIFEERRDLVRKALLNISSIKFVEPRGAFYFFVDIRELLDGMSNISSSKDFCMMLLNEVNVATVPGSVFGLEGYIRISYAKSKEELKEAMNRIKEFIQVAV